MQYHLAFTHLETRDFYARLLFLDFSSAFDTIIPQTLVNKLAVGGIHPYLCNWALDFFNQQAIDRIHKISSSPIKLNSGSPQGCILSPLLYTPLTHNAKSST